MNGGFGNSQQTRNFLLCSALLIETDNCRSELLHRVRERERRTSKKKTGGKESPEKKKKGMWMMLFNGNGGGSGISETPCSL